MLRPDDGGGNDVRPSGPALASPAVAPRLELTDVSKSFGDLAALSPVSISVADGEVLTLLGPSGCGKTTLLRLIAGLERPSTGTIAIEGGPPEAARRHKRIGFVPQSPALLPWRTVAGNASLLLDINRGASPQRKGVVDELLARVGLAEFADAYPHELSGGMQQRVGLVRAFALDAPILLMDEPFAALDALTRRQMQEELLGLWEDTKFTVLFVTHSIEEAVIIGSRILIMSPHPGQVKAELNAHEQSHATIGDDEFAVLQSKIHNMIFADRVLEEEAIPHA
jgi:NitT/TauT family transport system ATP-binding protein